jgi:DNA-binding transcriptional LysR family regulator
MDTVLGLATAASIEPSQQGDVRDTKVWRCARHTAPFTDRDEASYPELTFELDLVEERIDYAVRLGKLADSSLIAHHLCDMVHTVCASPAYLRRHGRPNTPRALAEHECLRYPIPGHPARWRFREAGRPAFEVPVRGRVIATNFVALRQCGIAGMGVLLLPRRIVADALRTGALIDLFPDHHATATEFDLAAWMVYPSRSYLPMKVRRFADFLKDKFKHGAPAEAGLPPGARH